jgi:hypothetical protein
MATEKLNEGQSVRVEQNQVSSEPSIDNINVLPEEIVRTRKRSLLVFRIICLLLVLIFVARVPYIGSYADSYIFELIFGNIKYAVYTFLILLLVFKMLHIRAVKLFKTKRFVLGFILLIIGMMLILAIAQKYLLPHTTNVDINSYMNGFVNWANDSNAQIYHPFLPKI